MKLRQRKFRQAEGVVRWGIYQHYSGDLYRVMWRGWRVRGYGLAEDVLEEVVIYQALYTSARYGSKAVWTRSMFNFLEPVLVDDLKVARFRYLGVRFWPNPTWRVIYRITSRIARYIWDCADALSEVTPRSFH